MEVGPAETTISEIARRAGVQRATVYNHFPDDASLFAACSAHWRARHPPPDPSAWAAIADPHERLRRALVDLYARYRETAPMTAQVLRDMERLPALHAVVESGLGRYLASVRGRLEVAIGAAVSFELWRSLAPLGDREAARLAASLVEAAARVRPAGSAPRARR
jgi:AcrR family transcriptional regulator